MSAQKKRRIKKTEHLLRAYEGGRSLTELLGVLAVVGIVAAGSVVGFDTMHSYWQSKETAEQILTAGTRYAVNHAARIRTSSSSSSINMKDVMPEATSPTLLNTADNGVIQMYVFTAGASSFEVSANISDSACDMTIRNGGYPLVMGNGSRELGSDSTYKSGTSCAYTPDCFTSDTAAKKCDSSIQTVNQLVGKICAKSFQHFIWDPAAPKEGTTYFYGGSSHYCEEGKVADPNTGICCSVSEMCGGHCGCPTGQYCLTEVNDCVECDPSHDRSNGTNSKCSSDKPYCVDNHCYECKVFGDDRSCEHMTSELNHKWWCSWGLNCIKCDTTYQIFNPVSGTCECTSIPDRKDATCTIECGCDYGLSCGVAAGQTEGRCQCTSSNRSVLDAVCNNQDCRCESSKGLVCSSWNKCACPANTTWADGKCCANTHVYTGSDLLKHCCATTVQNGQCCATGTTWVDNECCPSNRIYTTGGVKHCCSEVVSDGHCCTGGKVWKEHICCAPAESEVQDSNGAYHCCANSTQYWWLNGSRCCPSTKTSGTCSSSDCPCTGTTECSKTYTTSFTNNARNQSSTTQCCVPATTTCTANGCACADGKDCKKVYNSSFGLSDTTKCCGENTGACSEGSCPCTTGSCNQYYPDNSGTPSATRKCCTPLSNNSTCTTDSCVCASGNCDHGLCCDVNWHNSSGHCCAAGTEWATNGAGTKGSESCCILVANNNVCSSSTCACQSGNCTNGHCCASGNTWTTGDNQCCLSSRVYKGADLKDYCCETDLNSKGQCCQADEEFVEGQCCASTNVYTDADNIKHCCDDDKVYQEGDQVQCCETTLQSGHCCKTGEEFVGDQCCASTNIYTGTDGKKHCCDDDKIYKGTDDKMQCCENPLTNGQCCGELGLNAACSTAAGSCPCTTGSCNKVFRSPDRNKAHIDDYTYGTGTTGYTYRWKFADIYKCVIPKEMGKSCKEDDACETGNCACQDIGGTTCQCCPKGNGLKRDVNGGGSDICCPAGMTFTANRGGTKYAQNVDGHCCPYGYSYWFDACPVDPRDGHENGGGCCATSSRGTTVLYPDEWENIPAPDLK